MWKEKFQDLNMANRIMMGEEKGSDEVVMDGAPYQGMDVVRAVLRHPRANASLARVPPLTSPHLFIFARSTPSHRSPSLSLLLSLFLAPTHRYTHSHIHTLFFSRTHMRTHILSLAHTLSIRSLPISCRPTP